MGLFDSIVGKLGGAGGAMELAAHYPALKDSVIELLEKKDGGGLKGLVEKFKGQGLGDIASSWISTGGNLPVSAQQITQALSPKILEGIAQKTGLSSDKVAAGLAFVLPLVVDKLTSKGEVPDHSGLQKGLEALRGLKF